MRGTAQTGSRYRFYLDATAFDGASPFPAVWPATARHLHVGSISAVDPRHGEQDVAALRAGAGARSHQFRPRRATLVTPDRVASPRWSRTGRPGDLVKASEEDLEWLYPDRPSRTP